MRVHAQMIMLKRSYSKNRGRRGCASVTAKSGLAEEVRTLSVQWIMHYSTFFIDYLDC